MMVQSCAFMVATLATSSCVSFCSYSKQDDVTKQLGEQYAAYAIGVLGDVLSLLDRETRKLIKGLVPTASTKRL
jgi:hypothetical protein